LPNVHGRVSVRREQKTNPEDTLSARRRPYAAPTALVCAALTACAAPPATPPTQVAEPGPQRRAIPPSGVHQVASGETLSEIAWIYRLDVDALARANGILDPDHVVAGRRLHLRWDDPPRIGAPPRRAARPAPGPVRTTGAAVAPLRVVVTPRN
jgi:LysM repeat protein